VNSAYLPSTANVSRSSRPARSSLTFLGGAGTVTGSRFLIETPKSTVLVDCGMFQGGKVLRERNWAPFPHDPRAIDAVVLTHAHLDHVGYLPRLVALGFSGDVVCTTGTAELARIVLPDSGHLQEEEAEYANRVGYSKHRPALPLYTEEDAWRALELLRPIEWSTPTAVSDDVVVSMRPAGHILGSAVVTVELGDEGRRIVFSGDLGRPQHPLLVPPDVPGAADIIVVESTYGGRTHEDDETAAATLASAITKTAARGGTVVIPAFAVDRTEVILFRLRELVASGAIPDLPVYVDSPMALRALDVYRNAIAAGSDDIRQSVASSGTSNDPFDTGRLAEVHDVEGSKALADIIGPAIIISASGMATGGRVLHHLARLLPDPRNTVAFVGFQAAGTRGQLLVDGAKEIKLLGRYTRVRADVIDVGGLSVHADHDELLGWVGSATKPPDTVFVVHGEPDGSDALRASIETELDLSAVVPSYHERVRV
jgi:metallo-beta-lactamase family protein